MKIIFTIVALLASYFVHAQTNFQGQATYFSKTDLPNRIKTISASNDLPPDIIKELQEKIKRENEKIFTLIFDKNASSYKEEGKLSNGESFMTSNINATGLHYKNINDKFYMVEKESLSKEFLIKETLLELNWKLTQESKKIGDYLCYKATAIKKLNDSDAGFLREKKVKKDVKTSFIDDKEQPTEVLVTAWYTPDIPVSQGPENYWGLPGLILEIQNGKTVILCTKVVLNTKEKKEIKIPNKGKLVSQKQYEDIVAKKKAEINSNFRNGKTNSINFGE
jgi:GLPGLI family protein